MVRRGDEGDVRMFRFLSFPFCLAVSAVAAPALAQTAAAAETIIVTATRTPQKPAAIGASVAVLDAAEIRAAGAGPVVDLLRDVPGVSFSRNGGIGAVTSVRVRGAEADQTVVLIDGVKLNDPSQPGGGFNFANLLLGDLDRVEVLRGPQSTLYGSQAIGGVVNLITREATRPAEASVALETGDLETTSLRAAVRGAAGALRYAASAGRFETAGISAAAAGRERDSYENTAAQARAAFQLSPVLGLEARVWWSSGEVGIDGFPAPAFVLADTPERSRTEERILYGSANLATLEGRWRTRLSFSQTTTDRESLNPALALPTTFDARGENDTAELQSVLDLTPAVQIVAGFEHETSRFRTASPSVANPNPRPATAEVDQQAFYAQIQASPTEGLTVTLGARATDHERFGEAINLRATLAWAINNGDTILRAAAADGFKAPSLFQLLSNFGNVALQPEEATSLEFGVEQALFERRLIASLTWFDRSAVNQIDFVSCFRNTAAFCVNRPFGTYDNIARTRADGLEATLEFRPIEALSLTAGLATLEARNDAGGSANFNRRLPRRPDQTSFLTAAWRFGPGREVSATLSRIGDGFDNAANTVRLPGYEIVTLRASFAVTERWSLQARIENAGDETYQTTAGYGSPPRQAFLGLRADF
jgi:vitamin B12 transporter